MADPRGRGFARGLGKWHARVRCHDWQMSSPRTYGWTPLCIDRKGLTNYSQDDKILVNLGWGNWAVVEAATGVGDEYTGWHIGDITADVFPGRIASPPEVTMADFYGVTA